MDLNKVTLIGRVTYGPESKTTSHNQTVVQFGLATNYIWRDVKTKQKKEQAEFHSVTAWGKLGDIVAQYLKKGSRLYLEGRLQTRNWEDKAKNKKSQTVIVADDIIMLDSRSGTKQSPPSLVPEAPSEQDLVIEEV